MRARKSQQCSRRLQQKLQPRLSSTFPGKSEVGMMAVFSLIS